MSQQAVEKLAEALKATRIIEPVEQSYKDGAVELLCRLDEAHHARWVKLIDAVKIVEERDADEPYHWRSRIFLEYFRRNGRQVKGWVVYVQSGMLLDAIDVIASALRIGKAAPPVNKDIIELDEMPLSGFAPDVDRNAPGRPSRNPDGSPKLDTNGRPIMRASARESKG